MKAQMLNIPSYIEDPGYRYKMARLQFKIEGKGNGIKTNLVNLVEVAKDLRVRTEYPLKFMGYEKGSQTKYTVNGNEINSLINGAFNDEELRQMMDRFIEKYVLCSKCKYPEMNISVVNKTVMGSCAACGHHGSLDNKHKLATFIVKNPPKNLGEFKKRDEKVDNLVKQQLTIKPLKKAKAGVFSAVKLGKDTELMIRLLQKMNGFYKRLDNKRENDGRKDYDDFNEAVDFMSRKIMKMNMESGMEDRVTFVIFNSVFDVNIAKNISKNRYLVRNVPRKFDGLNDQKINAFFLVDLVHLMYFRHSDQNWDKFVPTISKLMMDSGIISENTFLDFAEDNEELKECMEEHFAYDEENMERYRKAASQFLDWLKQFIINL